MHNVNQRTPDKDGRPETGEKPWWQPGLILFSRMSSWILGPVIVAVFVGRWLDDKYGTKPWLFLVTVAAAFIISMIGIVKEGIKGMQEADEQAKKDKKKKDPGAPQA